jgi:hypothetical protein
MDSGYLRLAGKVAISGRKRLSLHECRTTNHMQGVMVTVGDSDRREFRWCLNPGASRRWPTPSSLSYVPDREVWTQIKPYTLHRRLLHWWEYNYHRADARQPALCHTSPPLMSCRLTQGWLAHPTFQHTFVMNTRILIRRHPVWVVDHAGNDKEIWRVKS